MQKKINVALIVFSDDDGKILLNKRADAEVESWELIGGGIEKSETPLEAVKREVFEEVGYKLGDDCDKLLDLCSFNYSSASILANVSVFSAMNPGTKHFNDSEETFVKDLKLFSIDEALKLNLLPMTRIVLDKIKKRKYKWKD